MSRTVIICAIVAVACVVFSAGAPALSSSDLEKFESFDLASVLSNKRLRTAYINCMVDQGPCAADAAEFKKVIPDLMETNCAECSAKLREMVKKAVGVFRTDYPEDFQTLMKHFDPEGKRTADLEEFMKS